MGTRNLERYISGAISQSGLIANDLLLFKNIETAHCKRTSAFSAQRPAMKPAQTPYHKDLDSDLEIIMSANEIFKIIRKNKAKISQFGVQQIGLFGSQSRGDATSESDLDFLVEFIQGQKNFDNYIELCFFLEALFNKKVDLLTPEGLSPHLKEQILREVQYETIH